MFSKESLSTFGLGKMLGAAWVIFTTVYFLLSIASPYILARTQNVALQGSFQNGQVDGYKSAVLQLGDALGAQLQNGCKEAIPLSLGSGTTIGLVSTKCLEQQAPAQGGQTPPAGAMTPAPAGVK